MLLEKEINKKSVARKSLIRDFYANKFSLETYKSAKQKQEKKQKDFAVERIVYQAQMRVFYNLKVIEESQVIFKVHTTNMTYEDLKEKIEHVQHHHHHHHDHPSKPSKDKVSNKLSSCTDHSSEVDADSFGSDESYYDENEDFELACINQ